jgi:uroporphyrinogen-III decarboxylase
MAAWLCGLQEIVFLTADQPALVAELLHLIAEWNLARMQVVLAEGLGSPALYRQFLLPYLKTEVETAHAQGVKFGYILTTSAMPLLDMILEAGVDVLLSVDPVQGGYDLAAVKAKARGRLCLWGGVNGSLTVEAGTPDQFRQAVTDALALLAPDHGFILSPVDGIYDPSDRTKRNLRHFVDAWKSPARVPSHTS